MTDSESMLAKNRKTPGVYVTEFDAFPPSVVGVATAVPIFIGYTETAIDPATGQALCLKAMPIYSLGGFLTCYGAGSTLAAQIALFYQNGGGSALVVSAGTYAEGTPPSAGALVAGIDAAGQAMGATMTVVPEACQLDQADYASVVQAMVTQAGTLQDRVAILDLPGCLGATDYPALLDCQSNLWAALAPVADSLSYAAAYGPALQLLDNSLAAPSATMAGVWTQNDLMAGVWNAPANVALVGVLKPAVALSDDQQGDFNVPPNGMAIDVLRYFPGHGTLVWGARTLDGNSMDYRFIQTRRLLIYLEQSIRLALQQYVFAPNDANTWKSVVAAVSNFLTGAWQQGGLMGDTAAEAFAVSCGVGSTMTPQDVLDGRMIVSIQLQIIRPAEFQILTITQQMGNTNS